MDETDSNVAILLQRLSAEMPEARAILALGKGRHEQMTFLELQTDSDRLADGLTRHGISRGDRVLLMVRPGIDFISLTFALFKIGAVAILIDPGLGRKSVLTCIGNVQPQGMIAIPLAHAARKVFPNAFRNIKTFVTVGTRWFWGGPNLDEIRKSGKPEAPMAKTKPDDPAAVLFTSGSAGPPKGVLYTHRMFSGQAEVIRKIYGIQKGEIDLPTFPLFALFGVSLGMTCVIPDMDPTRPANVNPETLTQTIKDYSVTSSFGSPALWNTVSKYCLENDVRLPTLKRILMAGAPVPKPLLERFKRILSPEAEIHTPYGATESLPVTSITHKEIINETHRLSQTGSGTCVGKPVDKISLKIIKISDEPIPVWSDDLELPQEEIGEIVVRGPWVSRQYYGLEEATRSSKIIEGDSFWHRMGDVGFLDDQGRLWFCGRKSQRVITQERTYFTIPCEAIFNGHLDVKRSALVGTGPLEDRQPVIIIEPEYFHRIIGSEEQKRFAKELLELGARSDLTRDIHRVLFYTSFPVDIRHNAKIAREKLALWAEKQ